VTLEEAARVLDVSYGHLRNCMTHKNLEHIKTALGATWDTRARRWELPDESVEAYASTRKIGRRKKA
jgi:hypothetical protein